ncbi:hypothetical protein [Haloprofundus sp. MHR1]|uniref:hypothetical protein n=1 Tax=Haloprofundus sp. MHR1 TaxID=2572921 RepID=UPI0010BF0C34|nr:hypothetical protein [Haloprofundus sp. MHR1]QCJ45775.1 hypothetical protein FCF25_00985 [Haloprofundus sp. MHR1]
MMGKLSSLTYYRGVNVFMAILSVIVIILFYFYLELKPSWAPKLPEMILGVPPFALTFGLLWYYLSSNPDPKILSRIHVVPFTGEGSEEEIAVESSQKIKRVSGIDSEEEHDFPDPIQEGFCGARTNELAYEEFPSKLKICFDIGNKGRSGVTLHEYWTIENKNTKQVTPLHDNRSVRIPPPLVHLSEAGFGKFQKWVNHIPTVDLSHESPWYYANLNERPKKIILQDSDERVFLHARGRRPESVTVPLKSGETRPQLVKGETYRYDIKIYTTSSKPTDSVTVWFVLEDCTVKWWTTRSSLENWLREQLTNIGSKG